MWRTFEIQILGWEEPEVVAEGGQFKQKSKLLLQNMLIIGEDALVGGQIIMASAMVISSKKALNMVLATSLRSNQFLHLNVFFLPYKKCSCVIFDPAMELNFGIIISFFFLGDRTASQLKTSSLVVEIG